MVPLKHPETPSGIPERDWMLTRRTLDHVPVKKKIQFSIFLLGGKTSGLYIGKNIPNKDL